MTSNQMVSGAVALPLRFLRDIKKSLTINSYNVSTGGYDTSRLYKLTSKYVYVPRKFAYDRYDNIHVDVSEGEVLNVNSSIVLRDYQSAFVARIMKGIKDKTYTYPFCDMLIQAHTGSGKTVMALEIAKRLNRSFIVLVDSNILKEQWIDSIVKFYGISRESIGILQGKNTPIEATICIGMIQSLYDKPKDASFYSRFGLVILDEVHSVGAEHFSNVLMQFSAYYKIGISATVERTDAFSKTLHVHFGDIAADLDRTHTKSRVYVVEYPKVLSWYANISGKNGRFYTELSNDSTRNSLVADILCRYKDRDALIISTNIMQLTVIKSLLMDRGIAENDIGLVVGYDLVCKYEKDPTPMSFPEGVYDVGVDFTPVKLQLVKKRVSKKDLANRKNCKYILSTYSMLSKAVDIPRLSLGIDAVPRSKMTQVHGRILRPYKDKKIPLWVTIEDIKSYKALYMYSKRLGDFTDSNVEIFKWHMVKNTVVQLDLKTEQLRVKQEVDVLKQMRIETVQGVHYLKIA